MKTHAHAIYFAGPYIFRPDATQIIGTMRSTCIKHGLSALIPTDNDIPPDMTPHEQADDIRAKNYDMVTRADIVIAEISPLRGPNMDPGTAAEIGYAHALKKTVLLWTHDTRTLCQRVTSLSQTTQTPTGLREKDTGLLVENFDLTENLMITAPQAHTGPIYNTPTEAIEAAAHLLTDLRAS